MNHLPQRMAPQLTPDILRAGGIIIEDGQVRDRTLIGVPIT
jgi:hypothetical protein